MLQPDAVWHSFVQNVAVQCSAVHWLFEECDRVDEDQVCEKSSFGCVREAVMGEMSSTFGQLMVYFDLRNNCFPKTFELGSGEN